MLKKVIREKDKEKLDMNVFKELGKDLNYKDILQVDGAFSACHINYGKSLKFNGADSKNMAQNSRKNSLTENGHIDDLEAVQYDFKEHRGEPFETLNIWNAIVTEQLKELLNRACEVQRVAGAWAALIAGPTVMSAIDIVYETEVDEFDNEELYTQGAYFILRAIMKMHGTEI